MWEEPLSRCLEVCVRDEQGLCRIIGEEPRRLVGSSADHGSLTLFLWLKVPAGMDHQSPTWLGGWERWESLGSEG